jgi:hypothetical protein
VSLANVVSAHAPGQVADRLAELARLGASGALEFDGDPGGIIYLSAGRLAFAESAAVPDPGSRLVNSRRVGVDQWRLAQRESQRVASQRVASQPGTSQPGQSQPDVSAGDLLLRRGLIDAAEWHALLRSAALDALLALAIQLTRAPAAAASFTPDSGRAGPELGMDIGSAWDHAWHEAERLSGYDVAPDARLRLQGGSRLVFGREASVVLGQMDGHATLRELAWRNGLALFAMLDWAARLVQDGVCAVTSPEYAHLRQRNASVQWTRPDANLLGQILVRLRQLDLARSTAVR